MSGVSFTGYRIYFESEKASEAVNIIEGALLDAGIYWDLEEIE
jgi:hypothetical protein